MYLIRLLTLRKRTIAVELLIVMLSAFRSHQESLPTKRLAVRFGYTTNHTLIYDWISLQLLESRMSIFLDSRLKSIDFRFSFTVTLWFFKISIIIDCFRFSTTVTLDSSLMCFRFSTTVSLAVVSTPSSAPIWLSSTSSTLCVTGETLLSSPSFIPSFVNICLPKCFVCLSNWP